MAQKVQCQPELCTVHGEDLVHWECRSMQVKWAQLPPRVGGEGARGEVAVSERCTGEAETRTAPAVVRPG